MGKGTKNEINYKIVEGTDIEKRNVVYSIENTITGNKYVGFTTQMLKRRLSAHFGWHSKSSFSNPSGRTPMYIDFNEYGHSVFLVRILHEDKDVEKLKKLEKITQQTPDYKHYSNRDMVRDFSRYREYEKIICSSDDGEILEFKSQAECGRYFKCDRTNVGKALKNNYKLLKKYTVSFK